MPNKEDFLKKYNYNQIPDAADVAQILAEDPECGTAFLLDIENGDLALRTVAKCLEEKDS